MRHRIDNFCAAYKLDKVRLVEAALNANPDLSFKEAVYAEMERIATPEEPEPEPPKTWWQKTISGGV